MVKYKKDFDSLLGEMNDYWGEHDLGKFIDNLLQSADMPSQEEMEVQVSLESNQDQAAKQHQVQTADQHQPASFDGDSLTEAA